MELNKKICTKCGEEKDFSKFNKEKIKKLGLASICKSCDNKRTKAYRRTKEGLITQIYKNQINTSKKRGDVYPTYTKQELKDWMFSQEIFHELYDDWKDSGYVKDLVPSCDRLDDYKGYNLKRLQLMTWGENEQKNYNDIKNGINNKNSIAVISVNKETEEEIEYYSMNQAERETRVSHKHISKCCLGERKSAGGFFWRCKD